MCLLPYVKPPRPASKCATSTNKGLRNYMTRRQSLCHTPRSMHQRARMTPAPTHSGNVLDRGSPCYRFTHPCEQTRRFDACLVERSPSEPTFTNALKLGTASALT